MAKHILLVEDEPEIRSLMALILAGSGYKVTEAENGEVALTLIQDRLGREKNL
jgi:CheY-like chemotaxis protein